MNKVLEKIRESILKPMQEMDIIVESVTYHQEGTINFLTIELDKVNGIDLDTIVEATKIINPLIDKQEDFIQEKYILDVYGKAKGE